MLPCLLRGHSFARLKGTGCTGRYRFFFRPICLMEATIDRMGNFVRIALRYRGVL